MERKNRGAASREDRKINYVDGSVVRKIDAAPKLKPSVETEEEQQRRRERRKRKQRARRRWERAQQMNKGYVVFLTMAVGIVATAAAYLIYLQADINTTMDHVANLKGEVAELRADNDATEKKQESEIDLEKIRDIAINQLGMVYPTKDQIINYHVQKNDYMNQYEDIPNK